jgi:hypothetical protein
MDHPIQSLDRIDVLGRRKGGGADLVIIVSSFLDDTPEHEHLLRQKIQNYVDTIFSDEFQSNFGSIEESPYTIILKCTAEPHPNMTSFIQAIAQYLSEYHINLIVET